MTQSDGSQGTVYEKVLDYARREIDEASSKLEELRRTLRLLESRVEAAKAVYEAVAARLNLEDELEEGADLEGASYIEAPPPLQAPEPPEESEESGNGKQGGFSVDLIRRHLEQRAERSAAPEEEATPQEAAEPEPSEKAPAAGSEEAAPVASGFPGLSDGDRELIGEYLRAKRDA